MKNINKIILVSALGVILLAGASRAASGFSWSNVERWAGYFLAEKIGLPGGSSEPERVGTAGDTYQTAKVYSKVISSNSTLPANINCNGWLITGVDFFVTPSSTASATTTISLGVAADATTTTLATTIDSGTFSSSTAVYMTSSTNEGAGITCSASQYISAVFGAAQTTTNGVLNVKYLIYQ